MVLSALCAWLALAASALAFAFPPPTNVLPFDLSLLQHAAAACQDTYCTSTWNYPGLEIDDMTLLESISLPEDEQRATIFHSKSQGIIVAYQGTNLSSVDSVTHDVTFWQVSPKAELGLSGDAKVFYGFQDQWYKSWNAVQSALAKAIGQFPGEKIVVTGHSMGASMAQLAALAIEKSLGKVSAVISFEPPRTGNPSYAEEFDKIFSGRYTGTVNGNDWVPSVPPRSFNYKHPSGMIWINPPNSTTYTFYPDSEDPRGPDSQIPGFINVPALLDGDWNELIFWGNHQGRLFGVDMLTVLGNCPPNFPQS